MSQSSKNLFGALMIGSALFILIAFDYAAYQESRAIRAAVQERTDLLAVRTNTLKKLNDFTAEYERRKTEIDQFSAVMPKAKGTAELISSTQSIAAGAGVQLTAVKVDSVATTSTEAQTISRLQVSIDGKGGYTAMIAFLDGLEKNLRLLDVDTITAAPEEGQGTILKFSIKATAYFIK